MFYISPVQEDVCRNGLGNQMLKWSAAVFATDKVLSEQIVGIDHKELSSKWLPEDNTGANLTRGFRRKVRWVFGYNGNQDIAIYAKFRIEAGDVHLDWVVARPAASGRVDCGNGAEPLKCMLAFMGLVGHTLNLPVRLLADNGPLVPKYTARGFVLTGRSEGSKEEMELTTLRWDVPSTTPVAQVEGRQWVFGGASTLAAYLADGTQ
jgi:hypothetical protein